MTFRIYPYKPGSKSASALARALGGRVIKHKGSTYRWKRERDVIINWGCSSLFTDSLGNVIKPDFNHPQAVRVAGNKKLCFEFLKKNLKDTSCLPPFTSDLSVAEGWRKGRKKFSVVCRRKLTGHSGEGITILQVGEDLPKETPLYVAYIPKKKECRVHLVRGELISYQEKKRRLEIPDDKVDWRVRSHDNGFIFAREGVVPDDRAVSIARSALEALSLDFGAVDLIWNEREDKWYFLEVNTAPGLEGQTVADYAGAFKK